MLPSKATEASVTDEQKEGPSSLKRRRLKKGFTEEFFKEWITKNPERVQGITVQAVLDCLSAFFDARALALKADCVPVTFGYIGELVTALGTVMKTKDLDWLSEDDLKSLHAQMTDALASRIKPSKRKRVPTRTDASASNGLSKDVAEASVDDQEEGPSSLKRKTPERDVAEASVDDQEEGPSSLKRTKMEDIKDKGLDWLSEDDLKSLHAQKLVRLKNGFIKEFFQEWITKNLKGVQRITVESFMTCLSAFLDERMKKVRDPPTIATTRKVYISQLKDLLVANGIQFLDDDGQKEVSKRLARWASSKKLLIPEDQVKPAVLLGELLYVLDFVPTKPEYLIPRLGWLLGQLTGSRPLALSRVRLRDLLVELSEDGVLRAAIDEEAKNMAEDDDESLPLLLQSFPDKYSKHCPVKIIVDLLHRRGAFIDPQARAILIGESKPTVFPYRAGIKQEFHDEFLLHKPGASPTIAFGNSSRFLDFLKTSMKKWFGRYGIPVSLNYWWAEVTFKWMRRGVIHMLLSLARNAIISTRQVRKLVGHKPHVQSTVTDYIPNQYADGNQELPIPDYTGTSDITPIPVEFHKRACAMIGREIDNDLLTNPTDIAFKFLEATKNFPYGRDPATLFPPPPNIPDEHIDPALNG